MNGIAKLEDGSSGRMKRMNIVICFVDKRGRMLKIVSCASIKNGI
ncbi:hypothetical protein PthBH41_18230 [Parageobacillus thermoglucosidasius]|nr:hypothetical protein PthBH41_18230 [Parageobacillus thermoglucosidasius]